MILFRTTFLFLGCWLLASLPSVAQLTITYPIPRMVVQRNQENNAPLYIAGTFSIPIDRVEARLVPVSIANRLSIDWTLLQDKPQNGLYQGKIIVPAGSFRLEVRGIRDEKTVSSAVVSSVGVGEVFLIAGQSNAMGIPDLGAKGASERVVSYNAWNRFWNKDNALESSDKPFPVPTFTTLEATSLVYPTGQTAWCWGELGDHIADRYSLPVAFFNVAIPATVADNWSATADGTSAKNIFNSTIWPFLQPYSNLRNALQYYHSQFGLRAVLWHHGESDAVPLQTPTETYRKDIQHLIDRSRADFGRNMTWVVARCSISPAGPTPSPAIINAQTLLANTPNNNVWLGPYTDTIQSPRQQHGHFENIANGIQGISRFATAWNENLNDKFFKESQPSQPQQFISTGLIPSSISAGTTISVPYEAVGFASKPNVVVQLLNAQGLFIAEVGRDKGNRSVPVYLPDTLSRGLYRMRVVATSPVLAGTPTNSFLVTSVGRPINPFIEVQVEQIDSTTHVHWLTAQEPPGSRFFIERKDGSDKYQTIGTANVLNDGQFSHLYSFTDPGKPSGKNPYRIRLEQPDGQLVFSTDIILAVPGEQLPPPTVYPNPNDGTQVTMHFPKGGQWNLTLINLSGQIVWQQRITTLANQPATIPLAANLPVGLYSLHMQSADYRYTKQLLIQR
ncbi:hypothetical protein BH09BAC4_BH09BAC4_11790 [soil metagenome]